MSESDEKSTDVSSRLDAIIAPEQVDELADILLNCDADGMLDIGELDGFLCALAISPRQTTLERWWPALIGQNPDWESPEQAARARLLAELYFAMVQERVSHSPFELGYASVPPLWSSIEEDDENIEIDEDADDADAERVDDDEDAEHIYADAPEDAASDAPMGAAEGHVTTPQWLRETVAEDTAADDDDDESAGELLAFEQADDDFDDDDEENNDFDDHFEVGETWLSGFRYGLSLQADDWRRVIDAEPALAPWLYALWLAADGPADAEPIDDLPSLPPTAASPENAGFLALEANLRDRAGERIDIARLVDMQLINVIPIVLHHLWRRNRQEVHGVADAIERDVNEGEVFQRDEVLEEVHQRLERIAVPGGGMNLETLDGYWSALCAGPADEGEALGNLDRIFGDKPAFSSEADAQESLRILIEYWKLINARQERDLELDDELCHVYIHFPPDQDPQDHPELPYGRDWAKGFLEGIEEFPRSAKLVLMDPEVKHWLAPIEALAQGKSLEHRHTRLGFEERMALIVELPECIGHLRKYWKLSDELPRQPVRVTPLPGRNDPCPCGSGKKYKKCHGAPERLN